jgi:hypothetical protein
LSLLLRHPRAKGGRLDDDGVRGRNGFVYDNECERSDDLYSTTV